MFNFIDIYTFITVSGCVVRCPSALLWPGAYDAVKTALTLKEDNVNQIGNTCKICVALSFILCVVFHRSLFVLLCFLSFGYCIICPLIYGFWLPNLQTVKSESEIVLQVKFERKILVHRILKNWQGFLMFWSCYVKTMT